MPFNPAIRPLTPQEARVLGTLMEKARTVPDSYPMSLNGLLTGCNQKTSREPVMALSDAQVQEALDSLTLLSLAMQSTGNRTPRWEHNFQRGVGVPEQSAVLLGLLMLRGPQTAAEMRTNAERWYRFADTSSVEAFLDELRERSDEKGGPLVTQLPRASGTREQRWAHLLCGPVEMPSITATHTLHKEGPSALDDRLGALESQVAALEATVQRLCTELGIAPQPD